MVGIMNIATMNGDTDPTCTLWGVPDARRAAMKATL